MDGTPNGKPAHVRPALDQSDEAAAIESLIDRLCSQIGEERVERYFIRDARLAYNAATLTVTVPSIFHAGLIDRRFSRLLPDLVAEVLGSGVKLRVEIDPEQFVSLHPDGSSRSPSGAAAPAPKPARRTARRARAAEAIADERFDLDLFLTGPSNHLAFDAAARIADGSATPEFRQLFIHGACGNGKTHLLRGIARRVRGSDDGCRIRYVAAEAFTNEYIQAIQTNRAEAFRQRHRELDVLCIDDVHFLSKKNATQLEIMHTLDAIEFVGARLVLASDEHPSKIADMHKALASRFVSGMVVEIQPPDRELKRNAIRAFAQRRGLLLSAEAIDELAALYGTGTASVRDLEGAVANLAGAYAASRQAKPASGRAPNGPASLINETANGGPMPAETLRRLMGPESQAGNTGGPIRFQSIRDTVCEALSIEAADLAQTGRHPRVVMGRAMITHLCKTLTTMSYPEIARGIGKRNHSTVITAHQRIAKQLTEPVRLGLSIDGTSVERLAEDLASRITSR